ncbi:NADPH-dependent FMN reductase [Halovenus rubra]|uniref:NADPH-dependent FMN reductase n=2 Tax=Halovenus rubra TaxID=869890 RepID=A0ACC7DWV6_9EURY|nr:NAD(P)H-dependent oxidoreductase [Halovenus rubra]
MAGQRWQDDTPARSRRQPHGPFENTAVGFIATSATPHHYLTIDQELRPLFAFFGAQTVGGSVYATDSHFDESREVSNAKIRDRLTTLARATVELYLRRFATGRYR